jgi:hypothetical protein
MSARVRDAFRAKGHDAWSADLLPTMGNPQWHIQADVLKSLDWAYGWDLLIAFPPCTDLSKAGAHLWKQKQADGRQQAALDFVQALMDAPVGKVAIENPVGRISTAIRKPDQIIQPWMWGDPYRKATCLWLKGLPKLVPDFELRPDGRGYWIEGRYQRQSGKPAGSSELAKLRPWVGSRNNYGAGDDYLGRKNRSVTRSLTFPGIAQAMADQWGQ